MTRTHICPLSLHDALPIFNSSLRHGSFAAFWLHNNKGRLTRGCNPTSSKFIHTWLRFGEIMRGSLRTEQPFLTQCIALMYQAGQPENTFPPGIVRQRLSPARPVAVNPQIGRAHV